MESSDYNILATTSTVSLSYDSVLPLEIIFEILLRLPVKSLLKFKCVSKSWLSLISTPHFINTHLKFSSKNQDFAHHSLLFSSSYLNSLTFYSCSLYAIMCFQESTCMPVEVEFPCKESVIEYNVVGMCDGLICICSDFGDLYLWNPCLRMSKKLAFSGRNVHCSSYLAYGFGYNECQDDYRVVEVVGSSHDEYGFQNEFRVYSLRTNSWEMMQDYPSVIFCNDPAKFVNGRLHWIATCVSDKNDSWFVSSLNLVNETHENVELPYLVGDWELGTLGGNLCVFCDRHKVQMHVWIMKEYGLVESWTKVVSIPYLTPPIEHAISPILISQNDEILLQHGSSLLLYNSGDNTFKHPQIQVHNRCGTQFSLYIESLVSPTFVEVQG